ncbi:MAG: alpha-amylase family glycosyl hydrolase [Actinomycetales bacterium]
MTIPWWRDAVIYQVYPRSFADADGDGLGDLRGITSRLSHLVELGVDALWCSPFYTSPQYDAGYDVADYRDIDPTFGTLADADELIGEAHRLGLRVIVDMVPNHTSSEHAWFKAALASAPGSRERARYVFRDGRGPSGDEPPTNWLSVFGGSAWTRVAEADGRPGQWYLHLFDVSQPDLEWSNEEVLAEFDSILRFWLDRGVDGFRVDVANGLVKEPGLRDWRQVSEQRRNEDELGKPPPMWDQDGVHDIYLRWRQVLDAYDGERILVAEAWVEPVERLALYTRPDEMHQAFNFDFLQAGWDADRIRKVVDSHLSANEVHEATTTWVLSNHDVVRHPSRFGMPPGTHWRQPIGVGDPQPDEALGLRRGRAATLLMLALPGSSYLYQGEELGLPEHTTLPDELRQDPAWVRSNGKYRGRDGCRVPLPWTAADGRGPSYGFNSGTLTWLPQPESFARYALDVQRGTEGSTYEMYRTALRLRKAHALGAGTLRWVEAAGPDVLSFVNGDVLVIANVGPSPVAVPQEAELLVASGPLSDAATLTPDTTVWLRVS